MSPHIRIGVLRLVDSAPVIVAAARGLFAALDLDVRVSVEPSWANVADKLAYGLLDAAVMLPPLVFASVLGLRGPKTDLLVPMGLTQGGNSIVCGAALPLACEPDARDLVTWLRSQKAPPRFAVVHRYSTHNILFRHWLAWAGVDPDRDVETVVVPPAQVVGALADGQLSGFCAGAPWGDVAEQSGAGRVLLGTSSLWPAHPEKCLAVHRRWAEANPAALQCLLRSLLRAQRICDQIEFAEAIADLLAEPAGLALPRAATRAGLPGGSGIEQVRFFAGAAWCPAEAHAAWLLGQMQRWGWVPPEIEAMTAARRLYRPDLAQRAARDEDLFPTEPPAALEGPTMPPFARRTGISR